MKTPLSYSQCLRVLGRKLPKKKRVRKKAMKRRRKMMKRSPSQRVSPRLGPHPHPGLFPQVLKAICSPCSCPVFSAVNTERSSHGAQACQGSLRKLCPCCLWMLESHWCARHLSLLSTVAWQPQGLKNMLAPSPTPTSNKFPRSAARPRPHLVSHWFFKIIVKLIWVRTPVSFGLLRDRPSRSPFGWLLIICLVTWEVKINGIIYSILRSLL